jgi:hypothetical protein
MIDPADDVPLILVPGSVIEGQVFTYMARQLGVDDDDSRNWRIMPATYVREQALAVDISDETLAALEVFYEQVHTARRAQEQPDDCDYLGSGDSDCGTVGPPM